MVVIHCVRVHARCLTSTVNWRRRVAAAAVVDGDDDGNAGERTWERIVGWGDDA
jgi:hypothetical protein